MARAVLPFTNFDLQATDAKSIELERTNWAEQFQMFFVTCNITSDTHKKAALLHYIDEEVYDIFQSLPASVSETPFKYKAAKA